MSLTLHDRVQRPISHPFFTMMQDDSSQYSLSRIASSTGLPVRRLRYALYHGLVPNINSHGWGKGRIRSFELDDAVLIAVAAALFEAGLMTDTIRSLLPKIVQRSTQATKRHIPNKLELGDGRYYRCSGENTPTAWLSIASDHESPPIGYQPWVTITLDLNRLADLLKR